MNRFRERGAVMHGIPLLFENNSDDKIRYKSYLKQKVCVYKDFPHVINTTSLLNLIKFINFLEVTDPYRLPIKIEFVATDFADKLSLTLFECICHYIVTSLKRRATISLKLSKASIWTSGRDSSPIFLLTSGKSEHLCKFLQKFELEIYNQHYRRYVRSADAVNSSYLSRIFDDIVDFQLVFNISKHCREAIAEVIVELVGNACDHTNSDCLLDIDIAPNYYKKDVIGEYFGINISIVNFSKKLFYDDIFEKLVISDFGQTPGRYKQLQEAFNNHQAFFDSPQYNDRDFSIVAAFQHKISGRADNNITGGTGLTKLIKGLEEQSDAYNCYMMSGARKFFFRSHYLEYNDEQWIGFNSNNDFFISHPALNCSLIAISIFQEPHSI